MLLPGLFHCPGLPPALWPLWTASTISRTSTLDPSSLWILTAGFQPLQGPHLHLQIPHRSAGAALWLFHPEDHFKGTSGVAAYSVLGCSPAPTRVARPVVSSSSFQAPQVHWLKLDHHMGTSGVVCYSVLGCFPTPTRVARPVASTSC